MKHIGLLVLSFSALLCAQEQTPPPPAPQAEAPAAAPAKEASPVKRGEFKFYQGHVLKVDVEARVLEMTVTAKDGTSETKQVTLDPLSRLSTRHGLRPMSELKPGMRIRVFYTLLDASKPPVSKRIALLPAEGSDAQAKPGGTGN